jgi:hypothetical protein
MYKEADLCASILNTDAPRACSEGDHAALVHWGWVYIRVDEFISIKHMDMTTLPRHYGALWGCVSLPTAVPEAATLNTDGMEAFWHR